MSNWWTAAAAAYMAGSSLELLPNACQWSVRGSEARAGVRCRINRRVGVLVLERDQPLLAEVRWDSR